MYRSSNCRLDFQFYDEADAPKKLKPTSAGSNKDGDIVRVAAPKHKVNSGPLKENLALRVRDKKQSDAGGNEQLFASQEVLAIRNDCAMALIDYRNELVGKLRVQPKTVYLDTVLFELVNSFDVGESNATYNT
jgi:hypothetical protein